MEFSPRLQHVDNNIQNLKTWKRCNPFCYLQQVIHGNNIKGTYTIVYLCGKREFNVNNLIKYNLLTKNLAKYLIKNLDPSQLPNVNVDILQIHGLKKKILENNRKLDDYLSYSADLINGQKYWSRTIQQLNDHSRDLYLDFKENSSRASKVTDLKKLINNSQKIIDYAFNWYRDSRNDENER